MSYATQLASATSLIQRKGAECTWRQTRANPVPAKPWEESGVTTTTDHTVYIAVLPFDSVARRMLGYEPNTPIPMGTMVGYMAGQSFTPALRDRVISGSDTYTIAKMDTINPDLSLDVLHILELRR